jgi:hypothetical protein
MRIFLSLGAFLVIACGASSRAKPRYSNPDAGTGVQPFTEPYVSMGECMKAWSLVRDEYDQRWGPSWGHDGEAYWTAEKDTAELTCQAVDDGAAVMRFVVRDTPRKPKPHSA